MVTVAEFQAAIQSQSALDVVDSVLLPNAPQHVSSADLAFLRDTIGEAYRVRSDAIDIVVTGSANLGFSLSEKRKDGIVVAPRYRPFSAASDIDVAVVATSIFDALWQELAAHAARSTWFPFREGKLGDYMISGWLRPDHFPKNRRLLQCDNWFDTFRRITASSRFRRRRVNGGLFYSRFHLRQYMTRSVNDCIHNEDPQ